MKINETKLLASLNKTFNGARIESHEKNNGIETIFVFFTFDGYRIAVNFTLKNDCLDYYISRNALSNFKLSDEKFADFESMIHGYVHCSEDDIFND